MKKITISLFMLLLVVSLTAVTVSVDFNDPSDLGTNFDIAGATDVNHLEDNGLGDTGCVNIDYLLNYDETRLVTYKDGFELSLDEPIIVSAYFHNEMESGYAGIGFSTSSSNQGGTQCQISSVPAIGMHFHGSRTALINNGTISSSGVGYDLNHQWVKVIMTITPRVNDYFDASLEMYYSDSNGNTSGGTVRTFNKTFENSSFAEADVIYPYFGKAWRRLRYVDNFSVTGTVNSETLPVTLSSFTAITTSNNFSSIQWTTASESNLIGYNIYRNEMENINTAIRINPAYIEATNSATGSQYTYIDEEVEINTNYYYWLQSTEINGFVEIHGPVTITISGQGEGDIAPVIPASELTGNYPNPFNPETSFEFFIKEGETGEFIIFNLKGQIIKTKLFETGQHKYVWNGTDKSGRRVASGSYFYKLKTESYQSVKKMIMQK